MQCTSAIWSFVAWPALHYFSTLPHKWHNFWEKKLLNIRYVFWFCLQLLSETFIILRRTEWDMIKKMCSGIHVKHMLFLSYSNGTLIFSTDFQKILKYQISWKSIQWKRTSSMQWTDRHDKANSHFSQFYKCTRKWWWFLVSLNVSQHLLLDYSMPYLKYNISTTNAHIHSWYSQRTPSGNVLCYGPVKADTEHGVHSLQLQRA